jgi:DNA end-binding protein Ku
MLEAMRDAEVVAIGRVVLRQKGHLVALRPHGDVLTMETLVYADEVVSLDTIEEAGDTGDGKVTERELAMARQLIEMLAAPFEPERFRDDYRDAVLAMIERKVSGEVLAVAPEAPAPAAVPDLMAALQASIDAVGRHSERVDGGEPAAPARARKATRSRQPAKKPARKS